VLDARALAGETAGFIVDDWTAGTIGTTKVFKVDGKTVNGIRGFKVDTWTVNGMSGFKVETWTAAGAILGLVWVLRLIPVLQEECWFAKS